MFSLTRFCPPQFLPVINASTTADINTGSSAWKEQTAVSLPQAQQRPAYIYRIGLTSFHKNKIYQVTPLLKYHPPYDFLYSLVLLARVIKLSPHI